MEDNSLLVIVLAFVLGCMCSGMMKQMCGQRLVEGKKLVDDNGCYEPGNPNVIKTKCTRLDDCNRLSFYYDVNADNNRARIHINNAKKQDLSCDGLQLDGFQVISPGYCKYKDKNHNKHQLCHDTFY